jgi:hypothetical protein
MSFIKIIGAMTLLIGTMAFAGTNTTKAITVPRYWSLTISELSPTTNTKTFNLDYATVSTVLSDTFNIDLYQNGVKINSQTTPNTGKGGDTGRFAISVPSDGTYSYSIVATNLADASTKTKLVSAPTVVNSTAPVSLVAAPITSTSNTTTTANTTASSNAAEPAISSEKNVAGESTKLNATPQQAASTSVQGAKTTYLGLQKPVATALLFGTLLAIGFGWYFIGRSVEK